MFCLFVFKASGQQAGVQLGTRFPKLSFPAGVGDSCSLPDCAGSMPLTGHGSGGSSMFGSGGPIVGLPLVWGLLRTNGE